MGSLAFYGSESGAKSGWARDYYRSRDNEMLRMTRLLFTSRMSRV